jgi:hypothetical protein
MAKNITPGACLLLRIGDHLSQVFVEKIVDPRAEKKVYYKKNPEYKREKTEKTEKLFGAYIVSLVKDTYKGYGPDNEQAGKNYCEYLFQKIEY